MKSTQIYECNSDTAAANGSHSYFYNARMSSQNESAVVSSATLVMMGETAALATTGGSATTGTATAVTVANADLPRHLDGVNYAFVDGHVKWFQSTKIQPSYDLTTTS